MLAAEQDVLRVLPSPVQSKTKAATAAAWQHLKIDILFTGPEATLQWAAEAWLNQQGLSQ